MDETVPTERNGVTFSSAFSDIRERRILVTGASSGIGAAVALGLGQCGAEVCVHFNANRAGAEAVTASIVAAGGKAIAIQKDVRERGAPAALVSDAVKALDGLDLLVNNAGDMLARRALADVDDDALDEMIALNVRSYVLACAAAVPHLRKSRGSIINVSSISAHSGGSNGANLYAASKAFISTYTRGLARELAPDRVRVNAVAPGVIETSLHARRTPNVLLETLRTTIPLGRLGAPEDCAGVFLYLACPTLSGYVTGQVLEVNGGQYMG
jgi:3-oxoacyl-[acyl-carrier protein] reductase